MATPPLQIAIDCVDPALLVRFWSAALGYVVEDPPGDFPSWNAYWRSIGVPEDEPADSDDWSDSIVDPDGIAPRIWFQQVPEPKKGKNRVHLDLKVSGGRTVPLQARKDRVDRKVAELVAFGATQVRVLGEPGRDYYGIVLQDPEGNEFCVA